MKTSLQIRKKFIDFFTRRHHKFYPYGPLIDAGESSTMFTVAGMQQFTNVFLGQSTLPDKNIITIQPCLRMGGKHNDIDMIGKTTRHNTFFEMLGNFSFGGYGKETAIIYAFEFIKSLVPIDRMFFTVHPKDNESKRIWKSIVGNRVIETDENFWQAGDIGPCGYCTEIYVSVEPISLEKAQWLIEHSSDAIKEVWNIVFIQYHQTLTERQELPHVLIDTGMGLERITSIVDGSFNNFKTDLLAPIVKSVNAADHTSQKTAADFLKSAVFLVAQGLLPGPSGNEYVLRKLIRSAAYLCKNPLEVVEAVQKVMGDAYPNLVAIDKSVIEKEICHMKDNAFDLDIVRDLTEEEAFKIYHTHGVPISQMLEKFPHLNEGRLQELIQEHKNVSHRKVNVAWNKYTIPSFHQELENESVIEHIEPSGDHFIIIVKESCFYPRGGGQEGDKGQLIVENSIIKVIDTLRKNLSEGHFVTLHICEPVVGIENMLGKIVHLKVDADSRLARTRAHSATHLLGELLMRKYGYKQNGSFVGEDYFRLDLVGEPISPDRLKEAEDYANQAIKASIKKEEFICPVKEVEDALLIEGHNYNSKVRVVQFAGYSKQLCGGTHVVNAKDIGIVKIKREFSIGKGCRRIEGYTGHVKEETQHEEKKSLHLLETYIRGEYVVEVYEDMTFKEAEKMLKKIDSSVKAIYFFHREKSFLLFQGFKLQKELESLGFKGKFGVISRVGQNKFIPFEQIKHIF